MPEETKTEASEPIICKGKPGLSSSSSNRFHGTHLSLKLSLGTCTVQVTRLEVLHEVASLLSACLADSSSDEIGDNVMRL